MKILTQCQVEQVTGEVKASQLFRWTTRQAEILSFFYSNYYRQIISATNNITPHEYCDYILPFLPFTPLDFILIDLKTSVLHNPCSKFKSVSEKSYLPDFLV